MNFKHTATNKTDFFKLPFFTGDRFSSWFKDVQNIWTRYALYRISNIIRSFDRYEFFYQSQLHGDRELGLGKDYSFFIADETTSHAYIGGKETNLQANDFLVLPDHSNLNDAVYRVDDICFPRRNMWIAFVTKVSF